MRQFACPACGTVLVSDGKVAGQCDHYGPYWWFDSTKQHGGGAEVEPWDFPDSEEEQKRIIDEHAREYLPEGTPIEYRIIRPTEQEPKGFLGWKYTPEETKP